MWTKAGDEARSFEDLKLTNDFAAIRFQAALVRWELKYRADQARKPSGPGGGQFTKDDGGRLGALTGAFKRTAADLMHGAASAAATLGDVESGVLGLPAAMASGEIAPLPMPGVTGSAVRGSNGVLVPTPFGMPVPVFPSVGSPPVMLRDTGEGREPVPQREFDEECDKQLEDDDRQCQLDAAIYGANAQERARIGEVCRSTAIQRYGECRRDGPGGVTTPLYDPSSNYPLLRDVVRPIQSPSQELCHGA